MVQSLDLIRDRCSSCPARNAMFQRNEEPCGPKDPAYYLACTQILRTSRQIYTEILPTLYSKNTIHVKCWACENLPRQDIWACHVEPRGVSTGRIEHYHRYVKNIVIASNIGFLKSYYRITKFADHWPTIEDKLLARYENTQHISVRMQTWVCSDTTFELVRRSSKPTTEHVHNYRSVLAQQSTYKVSPMYDLAALEETCNSILLSNALGKLKDTAFTVQSIHWKPKIPHHVPHLMPFTLYLGCDKHHASNTLIEQLLAKREV